MTGHRIDLRSHPRSGYINSEMLAVGIPGRVDHARGVRDRGWRTARINAVDAVIIAKGNRPACKAATGPVPAPIRPSRCEGYKRVNVAGGEICNVQLHIVRRRGAISLKNNPRRVRIQDRAEIVDL